MKILFVCKSNAGRSQMAAAFFNRLSQKHQAIDAGNKVEESKREGISIPSPVIDCMKELGYDLSKNIRKQVTPEMAEEAEKIIMMDKQKDVPAFLKGSNKIIYWDVEDASGTSLDFHCQIRDQIKNLVEKLIEEIR